MARQLLGIPFLVPLRGCFGNYKIPKLMGRRPVASLGSACRHGGAEAFHTAAKGAC